MTLTINDKKKTVDQIKEKLKAHKVVAVASIAGLKSRQYNAIKKKIRGKAIVIVARKTLMQKALSEALPEAAKLREKMIRSEVLIASDLDAFKLFKLFKDNKTKAIAKPGQLALVDIIVPAGETNLPPGPVLTELKQAKIDAKILGPKIIINKDSIVAKAGQPISTQVAGILAKLGIEPFEVGVEIRQVFENGDFYNADVLDIDESQLKKQLAQAHREAVNLCVYAEIFNSTSIELLIMKAAREANAIQKVAKLDSLESGTQAQVQETAGEAQQPPQ